MKKTIGLYLIIQIIFTITGKAQSDNFAGNISELSISKIMQAPDKWIGTLPDDIHWSENSMEVFFTWKRDSLPTDQWYKATVSQKKPQKITTHEVQNLPAWNGKYNKNHTLKIYSKNGDIFLYDIIAGKTTQITNTNDYESSPAFCAGEKKIVYAANDNLFTWQIETGQIEQITNIKSGTEYKPKKTPDSEQDKWLHQQQLELFNVLATRKAEKESREALSTSNSPKRPKAIYIGSKYVNDLSLSPNGDYATFILYTSESENRTQVPNYVTESGYTENIPSRAKVGTKPSSFEMGIYDIKRDSVYYLKLSEIDGIKDSPIIQSGGKNTEAKERSVIITGAYWSDNGENAMIQLRSGDNKDRWILQLDAATGSLSLIDRQHDDAWIGGPGIGSYYPEDVLGWMPDNQHVWFQSEESGYSHLYVYDTKLRKKKALTSGAFEVYEPRISRDKKWWYFISNEVHPGEQHFYKMPIDGGKPIKITNIEGANEVFLSPDEKMLALRFSSSNQPWELYLMENKPNSQAVQITHSLTKEFSAYNWRKPTILTFTASDGQPVYARLFEPDNKVKNKAAVIFVHGAGYLQNAHKWWSSYYREYMFDNLLVDNGYTVLDIDYRGSAGYGRDWRTGIYRHMGGKDLSDQVDGAKMLIEKYQIDPQRIGIYGGSYGGFITLMAMFTQPDVFAAGAALRSVTDWAHYNHGYTSNILNTPVSDSIAYAQSSPIYYAQGLKGALLILHGMVDTNVHFQDVVRLSQRLIELEKDNRELAIYPVENHSFVEPSSWVDEYKRIFKLFQDKLIKN